MSALALWPFGSRDTHDQWVQLTWPRDLDGEAAVRLVRHLAASRRPASVTFETWMLHGGVVHFAGTTAAGSERLVHLFRSYLPDVMVATAVHPDPGLRFAIALRLGSRERALRLDAAPELSQAVLGTLAAAKDATVLQLRVGKRLPPSYVPQDSIGLPSTARSLTQAVAHGLAPLDAKARRELQAKVGERGFGVDLRVATASKNSNQAETTLRQVLGAVRVIESAGVPVRARSTNASRVAAAGPRRMGRTVALNVLEVVGLLAWPLGDRGYPGVGRVPARRLPVPAELPRNGRVLGDGNHPSSLWPIAVSERDSLMHTHLLGPTGVGKSTLLANLVLSDVAAGHAVCVVEPKGDLVEDILDRIPAKRERDVVVLDVADDQRPVGLNPLASVSPELAADQVLAVFRGLYGDYLGPRTTDILQAALLTLARAGDRTLVDLPLLLTDEQLRRRVTAAVRDDVGLGPFWSWYESLSEAERHQVIGPVMNKVRPFLVRERVRDVLGQAQPRFDIGSVFTDRRILLVPLAKGSLGAEAAGLIGSLVVAQLWQAAQSRSALPASKRHPVSIVIDEFQDFLHLPTDLADVLAQARGLGVGLTLAHQHLAQLSPSIRSAVLANARNRVCFRLSAEDASVMARTTELLDAADFQQLGRYEVYASLLADGAVQPYCSGTTRQLSPAVNDAKRVRALSRDAFGVDRSEVEAQLRAAWTGEANTQRALGTRRRTRGEQP